MQKVMRKIGFKPARKTQKVNRKIGLEARIERKMVNLNKSGHHVNLNTPLTLKSRVNAALRLIGR